MENYTFFEKFFLMLIIGVPLIGVALVFILNAIIEMLEEFQGTSLEELFYGGIIWGVLALILTLIFF